MLRPGRGLPTSAELDRRLAASHELAAAAQQHIELARRIQDENNLAAIVEVALGLRQGRDNAQG